MFADPFFSSAQRPNPFSQEPNPWAADEPPRPAPGGESQTQTRAQRLAELFRPPYELISHLAFEDARTEGREEKKWILVNIQDMSDFNCQVLNRDIWKDQAVVQIVKENFIFLQYTKDDPHAMQYIQYYMSGGRHENPDNYPHVAIVDPRTGEQVKTWTGKPFPDALDFHAQLAEFLDRYSLAANSKNPVAKSKPRQAVKDVSSMTEEEMLQIAMANSLEAANGSATRPSVHDPDELTASVHDIGKGKEKADDTDLTEQEPTSTEQAGSAIAFQRIPHDRPHEEPANNPATTTRIQFRHSGGRVIRRFAVEDRVQRIYEWLKAEPLEGRAEMQFELKVMPQGRDLLEDLNKTIGEAGLKQATVMIEYIEE
jgi:UBX domain-containing protein 7